MVPGAATRAAPTATGVPTADTGPVAVRSAALASAGLEVSVARFATCGATVAVVAGGQIGAEGGGAFIEFFAEPALTAGLYQSTPATDGVVGSGRGDQSWPFAYFAVEVEEVCARAGSAAKAVVVPTTTATTAGTNPVRLDGDHLRILR